MGALLIKGLVCVEAGTDAAKCFLSQGIMTARLVISLSYQVSIAPSVQIIVSNE